MSTEHIKKSLCLNPKNNLIFEFIRVHAQQKAKATNKRKCKKITKTKTRKVSKTKDIHRKYKNSCLLYSSLNFIQLHIRLHVHRHPHTQALTQSHSRHPQFKPIKLHRTPTTKKKSRYRKQNSISCSCCCMSYNGLFSSCISYLKIPVRKRMWSERTQRTYLYTKRRWQNYFWSFCVCDGRSSWFISPLTVRLLFFLFFCIRVHLLWMHLEVKCLFILFWWLQVHKFCQQELSSFFRMCLNARNSFMDCFCFSLALRRVCASVW